MFTFVYNLRDRLQKRIPYGAKRSPEWRRVRAIHLFENPSCLLCGGIKKVEVHHIIPFHMKPESELDPANLVTLCESGKGGVTCHLAFGHLGNYQRFNPYVVQDCVAYSRRMKSACSSQALTL